MSRDDKKYETGPLDRKIEQVISMERFRDEKSLLFQALTRREKAVLELVAQGRKNSEIAAQLGISVTTVQNHRANIRDKLSITRDSDYHRYAYAFDLVDF